MKAFGQYAAASLALILVIGSIAWFFTAATGRPTLVVSAGLAFLVQLMAFQVARALQPQNLLLGWGLGSLMRLMSLVLYAIVVAKLWRAPITPALLSFAAFLFVTTVVEPIFLKR